MREIKFKAWDKKGRILYPVSELIWTKDGKPQPHRHDITWKYRHGEGAEDSYVLIQYTGLKDKNGKEIYEGDILQAKTAVGDETWSIVVEWGTHHGHEDEWIGFNIGTTGHVWEVIGNIWETPELLEEKGDAKT